MRGISLQPSFTGYEADWESTHQISSAHLLMPEGADTWEDDGELSGKTTSGYLFLRVQISG